MGIATLVTGVTSVLIGGGLFAFVQFLINRHDDKNDKFKEVFEAIQKLTEKVDDLAAKNDERHAVNMRVRILRFRDEMLAGQNHTHDSFQQVLNDIDEYEKYCAPGVHPEFKNGQTEVTIDHIKANYRERLERHDFL